MCAHRTAPTPLYAPPADSRVLRRGDYGARIANALNLFSRPGRNYGAAALP